MEYVAGEEEAWVEDARPGKEVGGEEKTRENGGKRKRCYDGWRVDPKTIDWIHQTLLLMVLQVSSISYILTINQTKNTDDRSQFNQTLDGIVPSHKI